MFNSLHQNGKQNHERRRKVWLFLNKTLNNNLNYCPDSKDYIFFNRRESQGSLNQDNEGKKVSRQINDIDFLNALSNRRFSNSRRSNVYMQVIIINIENNNNKRFYLFFSSGSRIFTSVNANKRWKNKISLWKRHVKKCWNIAFGET